MLSSSLTESDNSQTTSRWKRGIFNNPFSTSLRMGFNWSGSTLIVSGIFAALCTRLADEWKTKARCCDGSDVFPPVSFASSLRLSHRFYLLRLNPLPMFADQIHE